jgi:UDP-N-acetylmuramoyl-L-alanyl-D-glutamate--2,6-diaminopimelate ligase
MIKSDSRRISPGDIFVALPGIKSNGNDYVVDAISRGASTVVVNNGSYDVNTIVVDDTRKYLEDYVLKNYCSMIDDMIIIGVTGTNGKTTVCYLLYQMLNRLGIKCSMIGTLGYYRDEKVMSLPNTCPDLALIYELLNDSYNNGYKCVVLEASSQGLFENRLYGVLFDYAIFTNITHDHLDYHKNFESYISAKQKLFMQLKSNGTGIVNADDRYCSYFDCDKRITYGFNSSDYRITDCDNFSFKFFHNGEYFVNHKLFGDYNSYNLMACLIVLFNIGFSFYKISHIISDIVLPPGRMELYNYKGNRIIVDYAHTPDAIMKVLHSVNGYNSLYAVFGCTGNRDRKKRPVMTQLLLDSCSHVIITSDDLYDESFDSIVCDMLNGISKSNYSVCSDRGQAIRKGISFLKNNDILLVLGKGHEEYLKVGSNLIPFNDGKFILDIINKNV